MDKRELIFEKKQKRIGKFPTKIPYDEFEEFYISNPGLTVKQMSEILSLSENRINEKIKQVNRKKASQFNPEISDHIKNAYKEGYRDGEEKGFLMGAGLGVGIGELLKQNGIGITDFITGIGKIKK